MRPHKAFPKEKLKRKKKGKSLHETHQDITRVLGIYFGVTYVVDTYHVRIDYKIYTEPALVSFTAS